MLAKAIYSLLTDDSTLEDLISDRVSPYVRNREDEFPCVVYSIDNQDTFVASDLEILQKSADVTISALSRSMIEAENVGDAILDIVADASGTYAGICIRSSHATSIRRDFGDPFDGSADLVYRVHIDTTMLT
jgi:hypothetical protein